MKKIIVAGIIVILLMAPSVIVSMTTAKDTPEGIPTTWGIVLFSQCKADYMEVMHNFSGDPVWWGCPIIEYVVIGIGRHSIHWELEYSVYTLDPQMPQPQNGTFEGNDSIYLFNRNERPRIKPISREGYTMSFLFFDRGEWWCRIYVDGKLRSEDYMYYEHH